MQVINPVGKGAGRVIAGGTSDSALDSVSRQNRIIVNGLEREKPFYHPPGATKRFLKRYEKNPVLLAVCSGNPERIYD